MKRILSIMILGIFLISLVSSITICIDLDPPSLMNSSLILTSTNNNINLNWIPATDIPDCSGIDYYEIYRGFNEGNLDWIANTSNTTYTDVSLSYDKTYYYMIHVFDLVGHNEGEEALSNSLYLSSPTNGPPPGGGGGGITTYWECGKWSECINETQKRVCEDIFGTKPNRTETKKCFPSFTPFGQGNETGNITDISQTTNFLTGAVTGVGNFVKSGAGALTFSVLVLVGAAVVTVLLRKRFAKKLSGETESGAESESEAESEAESE